MQAYAELYSRIFNYKSNNFADLALDVFQYQYSYNPVYKKFVDLLGKSNQVHSLSDIPFMPVEFFKNNIILSKEFSPLDYFESSGTTDSITSKHYFDTLEYYEKSYLLGFEKHYGSPKDWVILGLLPSYLEREHASLVNMVQGLMKHSSHEQNGFYLYNYKELHHKLDEMKQSSQQVLLFGVTFALLEFAHLYPGEYPNLTILETGGMKGRGKELTREELHRILDSSLHPKAIHSEYGMTEMFSQAYSTHEGVFYPSPTLKVLKRNPYDPLDISESAGRGNINVIDLSNLHSCSFIATMDVGQFYGDGTFKVLGRSDFSDVRGCNLMFS